MTVGNTTRTNREIGLLPSEQLMAAAAAARVGSPFWGDKGQQMGRLERRGGVFDS